MPLPSLRLLEGRPDNVDLAALMGPLRALGIDPGQGLGSIQYVLVVLPISSYLRCKLQKGKSSFSSVLGLFFFPGPVGVPSPLSSDFPGFPAYGDS